MSVYVFLGPSLPRTDAMALLDATVLPPIQQGDLLRLLPAKPVAVGIIDGYFETVPSVWHKEILYAMKAGVHVFGAASMGALRASELHTFGMIGVGTIFEWYRDGSIVGDDEVAIVHAPAEQGYRSLSVALVDVRDACDAAVRDGVIQPEWATAIVETGAALPFVERSYESIADRLRERWEDRNGMDRWLQYVHGRGPGLKARDAMMMLRNMRTFLANSPSAKQVTFDFHHTVFFEQLMNEVELSRVTRSQLPPESDDSPLAAGETIASLRKRVLLRILARLSAQQMGLQVSTDEVQAYADDFRDRYGLSESGSMQAWMTSVGLDESDFWQFANDAIFIERLARLHSFEIERELSNQLRLATARTWSGESAAERLRSADATNV